jgi:hypothetical protein
VLFWLKQGGTDPRNCSAIQFGLFSVPEPNKLPDARFVDYIADRVASSKAKVATHALLVHMVDSPITNCVALAVDDVAEAYRQQIAQWRKRARNTKTPTLWFEDSCNGPDEDSVTAVTSLESSLASIGGLSDDPKGRTRVEEDHGRVGGANATAGVPDALGQPLQVALRRLRYRREGRPGCGAPAREELAA